MEYLKLPLNHHTLKKQKWNSKKRTPNYNRGPHKLKDSLAKKSCLQNGTLKYVSRHEHESQFYILHSHLFFSCVFCNWYSMLYDNDSLLK